MSIIFWGTSEFACPSLERIFQNNYEIKYVVTAREKKAGRGLKIRPSPVKTLAEKLKLKVIEPENPNVDEVYNQLCGDKIDFCVLAAYGFIIKPKLLSLPSKGFINIHPSLLPKYRGAAPIQRAIINGEKITGVTTFLMNEQMDAGDILLQSEVAILENETYDELQSRLAELGADLIIKTLKLIEHGQITPVPQDSTKVTFAPKIKKEECLINWNQPILRVHNLIRGLSSEPGAYTYFRDKRVKILKTRLMPDAISPQLKPGQIVPSRKSLLVFCQDGYLEILLLQIEGSKIITGIDFINGQRLKSEEYFG
ncbi:MAG: methionyl-tRNA formyltransferase [candidate division WOR-3 bacterium]|nr:methionyl-tRNA formyltransferase [candidate division WOR-3 bacterium]